MSSRIPQKRFPLSSSDLPFYVYTWAYPDGVVFYVGMGKDNRAFETRGRSPLVTQICKSIEKMGHHVQKVIIARFKVRQHAYIYEGLLINTYGLDHLANIKSENGPASRQLAKPYEHSTLETSRQHPKNVIDRLTLERVTLQPWEDDGAAI